MGTISIITKVFLMIPSVTAIALGGFFLSIGEREPYTGLLYFIVVFSMVVVSLWKKKGRAEYIYYALWYAALLYYLVPVLAALNILLTTLEKGYQYIELVYFAFALVGGMSLIVAIPLAIVFHVIARVYKHKRLHL